MGITIESTNFSVDMGYGGFMRFRKKIAALSSPEFGEHYSKLDDAMLIFGDAQESFFKEYDAKTNEFINSNMVTVEIANFCYQSDCDGSIDQSQAKQLYEKIKDDTDDTAYGYIGRSDCAMLSDLKNIFKDCAENGGTVNWW